MKANRIIVTPVSQLSLFTATASFSLPKQYLLRNSPHLHNYPTETLSINYPNCQASEKTWYIVSSIFRISILFQK